MNEGKRDDLKQDVIRSAVDMNPGDAVQVREKSKKLEVIHSSMKRIKDNMLPPWLNLDKASMVGTFLHVPERADVPLNANEQLVVELYSK